MRLHQTVIALFLIAVTVICSAALAACTAAQDKIPNTSRVQESAPAEAVDAMASFACMVSGEWRVTTQSGTTIFDTWHWGPGKHAMLAQTYAPARRASRGTRF